MYKILSIINRALIEKKKNVLLPNTVKSLLFCKLLYKQLIISKYIINFNKINIYFNVINNKLIFNRLKTYKHLNTGKYLTYKKLKKVVFVQKKILILTTPVGIISSEMALKYKTGGTILVELI